jgi:hypothetical protein
MAHLILLRNPLAPTSKEEFELQPGQTVIDWLQAEHPSGFGMPIRFYVNGDEKPLDDLDYMPTCDDVVIIALMPGGFLAAMPLLVKVVIGLAVMAASYFAMQLFAPKVKKPKTAEEKEVFSIDSDQNAAKYGDPIPVVYGDVWMAPDYASQPVTWYDWSEKAFNEYMSGIQYLDLIMCVGQGDVDVTNVKVGASDAASLGNLVWWRTFKPNEHKSQMGVISAAFGGNFHENVVTCTDVGNQEFIEQGDQTQFYTISKPGVFGRYFQVDVIFPNGLYKMTGKGDMKGFQCNFIVAWCQVDANGNLLPVSGNQLLYVNTGPGSLAGRKNPAEVANPVRRTFTIDTGLSARWAVQMIRSWPSVAPDYGMTTFVWSGLKLIVDNAPRAYGNVTLLAARIKASRGVGSDAAVRVTARCKRNMNLAPNGAWGHSTSAADAFYDVYTNSLYGAARPVSELDMTTLSNLKSQWGAYQFNHVFRDRTTVWEALKTITVGMAAEPLPLGSQMSVAQDGVKPVRSMLFTDANIVEGTMKVNYMFDVDDTSDGVEVQYISPQDWQESFVRYPANSVIPETVTLPGCTSATHAAQYAKLVWQRTRQQRKRISFDTELEGIILNLGDRIAISHEMPKWGDNGLVLAVNGNVITLDHDLDWSGTASRFMIFRKSDGSPSDYYYVAQGPQPNQAYFAGPFTFTPHVDDDYDYTSFAFGIGTTQVRDFTVASTRHTGETTVSVEAVNYAPEIFDGAMTFLGGSP